MLYIKFKFPGLGLILKAVPHLKIKTNSSLYQKLLWAFEAREFSNLRDSAQEFVSHFFLWKEAG